MPYETRGKGQVPDPKGSAPEVVTRQRVGQEGNVATMRRRIAAVTSHPVENSVESSEVFGEDHRIPGKDRSGLLRLLHRGRTRRAIPLGSLQSSRKVRCGCCVSHGYGSRLLLDSGALQVTSIKDIHEPALRFGVDAFGIRCALADAARLPLRNSCVDLVASLETVEHLPDPPLFIAQIRRILKPGGLLFVTTPNGDGGSHSGNPWHIHEFSRAELGRLLADHGFIVKVREGQAWSLPLGSLQERGGFVGSAGSSSDVLLSDAGYSPEESAALLVHRGAWALGAGPNRPA